MSDAVFQEKLDRFRDLKPGDVAVSLNREKLFVCGWSSDPKKSELVILDLKNLHNQYLHHIQPDTPIVFLRKGDVFIFTI